MIRLIFRNCQKLQALRLQRAFKERQYQQVGRRTRASFEPPDAPGLEKVEMILNQLSKLNGQELRVVRQYVGEMADQNNYLVLMDRVGKSNPVVAAFLEGAIFGERSHRQLNSAILRQVSKSSGEQLEQQLGEDVRPASKEMSLMAMMLSGTDRAKAVDYLVPQFKNLQLRKPKKLYPDAEVKDDKKGGQKKKK